MTIILFAPKSRRTFDDVAAVPKQMMTLIGILWFLALIATFPAVMMYSAYNWLSWRWRETQDTAYGNRIAILLAGALIVSSPFLIFKVFELRFLFARVPAPLKAWWIEYRLEDSWGIGLPGDNETGFVMYRMTGPSARWARSQGRRLGEHLPGGAAEWHQTPVVYAGDRRWHRQRPGQSSTSDATVRGYLGRYGFGIPIAAGRDTDTNEALGRPGSFYSYGRGGSLTVVDPGRSKIYFLYAG